MKFVEFALKLSVFMRSQTQDSHFKRKKFVNGSGTGNALVCKIFNADTNRLLQLIVVVVVGLFVFILIHNSGVTFCRCSRRRPSRLTMRNALINSRKRFLSTLYSFHLITHAMCMLNSQMRLFAALYIFAVRLSNKSNLRQIDAYNKMKATTTTTATSTVISSSSSNKINSIEQLRALSTKNIKPILTFLRTTPQRAHRHIQKCHSQPFPKNRKPEMNFSISGN